MNQKRPNENHEKRNEEWNVVGTLQNVKDFDSKYYDKKVKVLWGRAALAALYSGGCDLNRGYPGHSPLTQIPDAV